ncbi:hypothetical protein FRB95_003802 [Tulasnella sp. JGI-2019a]|nr:hypothetical protein FRB93_003702 [Tulasnella sp. JGI-2019a]KAG9030603.1 hypothetical protein FRB95_003802 [Tulasnella sp. JGI-2019a]
MTVETPQLRILLIGTANAGKTTILRKLGDETDTLVVRDRDGNAIEPDDSFFPTSERGKHNIDNEIFYSSMPKVIFHDSCGLESGSDEEMSTIETFIARRKYMGQQHRVHVVWLCMSLDDGRHAPRLLHRNISDVPVITVFTKYDALEALALGFLRRQGQRHRIAMRSMPSEAERMFQTNWLPYITRSKNPPAAHICLKDLHRPTGSCDVLLERTYEILGQKAPLRRGAVRPPIVPMESRPRNVVQHTLMSPQRGRIIDSDGESSGSSRTPSPPPNSTSLCLSTSDAHLIIIPDPTRSVGGGGFCDLFLGKHAPTGQKLAMKRPRIHTHNVIEIATATRRFFREAKTWSGFKHDNILPFCGLVEKSDDIYLISPWMEYGNLLNFVSERLSFLDSDLGVQNNDPKRIAYMDFSESKAVHGIASGLAYLHAKDVIHGDLKAVNVLLSDALNVMICDFGMSKINDAHTVTSTAMKGAGSCRWTSPEVMCEGPKTTASDVYAFGLTIVEILTGSVPLPGLNQVQVIRAIIGGQRPVREPSSRLGRDFTPLWDIASACWAPEPSERPTIAHVVETIEQTVPPMLPPRSPLL